MSNNKKNRKSLKDILMWIGLGATVALTVALVFLFKDYKQELSNNRNLNLELEEIWYNYNTVQKENKQLENTISINSIVIDSLKQIIEYQSQEIDVLIEDIEDQIDIIDNISYDSSYQYLQGKFPDKDSIKQYDFSGEQVKEIHKEVIKAINSELIISKYEELNITMNEEFYAITKQNMDLSKLNRNLKTENTYLRKLSDGLIDDYNRLRNNLDKQKTIKNIAIALGITEAAVIALLIIL